MVKRVRSYEKKVLHRVALDNHFVVNHYLIELQRFLYQGLPFFIYFLHIHTILPCSRGVAKIPSQVRTCSSSALLVYEKELQPHFVCVHNVFTKPEIL